MQVLDDVLLVVRLLPDMYMSHLEEFQLNYQDW